MEQQTQRQLFLLLSFKGTNYHGFQVQENAVTIASTVQDAVEKVFHKRLDIKGCSRTDAGVHANAFGLTLKTDQAIPCDALVRAMNVNLPADIAVFDCYEVPLDFHPRYSCKGKQYVYKIWNCSVRNPFLTDQLYHFKYPLDVNLMDQAAKAFLGEHDFSAFCSSGSSVQDHVRRITQADVTREGNIVLFSVTGNGFLYNMVRIMAGTLLLAGQGKLDYAGIVKIIEGKDRALAGQTAPAHGLCLNMVYY